MHITQEKQDRLLDAFLRPLSQAALEIEVDGMTLRRHMRMLIADSVPDYYDFGALSKLSLEMIKSLQNEIIVLVDETGAYDDLGSDSVN